MSTASKRTASKRTANRFNGILDANRARGSVAGSEVQGSVTGSSETGDGDEEQQTSPLLSSGIAAPQGQNGKSRAKGKSSNPDYVQISAYVRKDTHKDARKLLLDDEQGRDLSDLMEELLQQWVNSRV